LSSDAVPIPKPDPFIASDILLIISDAVKPVKIEIVVFCMKMTSASDLMRYYQRSIFRKTLKVKATQSSEILINSTRLHGFITHKSTIQVSFTC
jgi:hypothetical protein